MKNNPKALRETVGMNKTIVILGNKENEIRNIIKWERKEMKLITSIMRKVSEEISIEK